MAGYHILIASVAVLLLAGCGQGKEVEAPPTPPDPPSVVYRCDNGAMLRATYPDKQSALVDYQGRTWTMRLVRAASGARYVGDGLQWWARGSVNGAVSMLAPGETFATGRGVQCFVSGADADQAPNPAAPGTPGGLPDDRTPLAETPFTPESAQGAANVVQTYYALIADRDYSQAWRLWGDEGKASGQQEAAFARSFDQYTSYNANVGAPGRIEGAAGSRYVEVPVQVYGQLKSGEAVNLIGTVGLKRTAEVSGSTPEQRAWRIAAAELKPAPAN